MKSERNKTQAEAPEGTVDVPGLPNYGLDENNDLWTLPHPAPMKRKDGTWGTRNIKARKLKLSNGFWHAQRDGRARMVHKAKLLEEMGR